MARDLDTTNTTVSTSRRAVYRARYQTRAYIEKNGLGAPAIKDLNFLERLNYGCIDDENYSVIPNESFLINLGGGSFGSLRVFDFVADAFSNMRFNFTIACQKGLIQKEGAAFAEMNPIEAYQNPRIKYDEYIGTIMSRFNNDHIPKNIDINNISSYNDYVKALLPFLEEFNNDKPITMSRWLKSFHSSILDTGLAIKYFDMPFDADQRKIDEIIDHPSFEYFKNLCLNMGFSIVHNNPNILLFDVGSPAAKPYLTRYGLFTLGTIFDNRYHLSHIHDMNYLINNINIYYNKFAIVHPRTKVVTVKCRKTVSTFISRERVSNDFSPFSEKQLLSLYTKIRNIEEGFPFTNQKVNEILRKAKYFQKKFDNLSAIGYISNIFKDQVWNKNYGYDDSRKRLQGKPTARSSRIIRGEGSIRSPSGGGTSSGY